MYKCLLIIFFVLYWTVCSFAAPASPAVRKGKTWEKSGVFEKTLVASKLQVRAKMTGSGYREKHEIFLNRNKTHSIILWEKGQEQVIFMLWQINMNQTGYSFGRTSNVRRK